MILLEAPETSLWRYKNSYFYSLTENMEKHDFEYYWLVVYGTLSQSILHLWLSRTAILIACFKKIILKNIYGSD